jgi:PIN domain nuclease of toxin-antitoxin system
MVDAAAERGELLLSPITAWEIGTLVRKGRLLLLSSPADFVRALFGLPGVAVAAITPAIAVGAATMTDEVPGDLADRILIATAQAYNAQFVTRDKDILAFARSSKSVRCLGC